MPEQLKGRRTARPAGPRDILAKQRTNRARGGKRWTPQDDARLLALGAEGHATIIIASVLARSFSSIQHRLRVLGRRPPIKYEWFAVSNVGTSGDALKTHQRDADLACDSISASGRMLVESLWIAIKHHAAISKRREPSRLSPEVEGIIGAIIREALISSKASSVWTRIAVSSLRAEHIGVDDGVLRNLLRALRHEEFLDVFVGYLGYEAVLGLGRDAAKLGRPTLMRASSRLINWSKRYGITQENVLSHFPLL